MKNALFINSLQGGGAERVVISLATGMLKQKMPIELICIERENSYVLPDQLKVHYLTQKQLITNNFLKLLYIPILGYRLKKLLKKNDISIVQSHLIRANILNVTATIFGSTHKSIIVNHNMVSFTRKLGIKGRIKLAIMNFFYSRAELILYISKVMQRDFQNTFHFKNSSKVIFNPHTIEEIVKKSLEPIADFSFESEKYYIVTSGRLIDRKRVIDLINAVEIMRKTMPNVELVVLGDGPEEQNIKKHIDNIQASEHVHLLGFKSNPFQYIKNSHIFVMASEREGLPNVLIESMACKTTVVSSDCQSGPREIIAPDSDLFFQLSRGYEDTPNGILYAVGDIDCLAEIIIGLLNDPKRSHQLAENAFVRIKSFELGKIVQEHQLILN